MIPALVLTAGLATRLRPLSFVRAKAALPVGGVPLVQRILRWLASCGVTDAVLNLHHLPHTITSIVGDGTADGVRVRYSWEMPVLGSAGGPRRALSLLGTSPFLIVNGDTLTNIDVRALVDAHRKSGALVTMAVIPNLEVEKYGGVVVESDGTVSRFATARTFQVRDTYHFIGVQVADAEVFAHLRDDVPSESVKEVYPALISARPGSVRAFVTDAEFFDIGTPRDYLDTALEFCRREATAGLGSASLEVGARSRIDAGAHLDNCVLWDDVAVEDFVRMHRCIVTDRVRVPGDTVWDGVTIRRAEGDLLPGERRDNDLAIGPIDGSARA